LQQLAAGSGPALAQTAKILTAEEAGRRRFATRLKAGERELEVEVNAAAYETAMERAVQFVVQDIGERNAQIRSLQESEAFFHGLCDALPAAVRLLDANARCNFASRGWEILGGAAADGDWLQAVNPQDRTGVHKAYSAAPSRRDEPVYLEYRLGDGSGERWLLDIVLPRFDAQGQWKGYLSTAVDISQRKRTEAALRAHAEDVSALLDRCPAPVWVMDSSGRNGYANQACVAWLGLKSVHAPDLGESVHPEDREEWLRSLQRHMSERARFDGIFRLRRFDDEYRHVHLTALPVAADDGGDTRFVGFLEDVTEFRRTAQALAVEEQRRSQIIALLGAPHEDELGQVRHAAEMVRVLFPDEPNLQQVSATVLDEARRLEKLVEEMRAPLRSQDAAGAESRVS
jgi:PAS domain S-box-containing protein